MEENIIEFLRESNKIEDVLDNDSLGDAYVAYTMLMKEERLSLDALLTAHKLLMMRHDPEIAGRLRTVNVRVGSRPCPPFDEVPKLIQSWLMNHSRAKTDEDIRKAHVAFEKIHPFQDGNGRIGRIILNWQREKAGLPTLTIWAEQRSDYYRWFK